MASFFFFDTLSHDGSGHITIGNTHNAACSGGPVVRFKD